MRTEKLWVFALVILFQGESKTTRLEIHNVGQVPVTTFSLSIKVEIFHQAVGKGQGYCTSHDFPVLLWNRGKLDVRELL